MIHRFIIIPSIKYKGGWYRESVESLEVQIIPLTGPGSICARSIRSFWDRTVDVLERELPLELRLQRGESGDELRARLFHKRGRCYCSVRLDLDEKVGMERMGHFVSGEQDLGHGQQLSTPTR